MCVARVLLPLSLGSLVFMTSTKRTFFLKGDRINRNRLRPIWSSIGYRFGLSEDVNYYATSSWELFTQGASDQFPGPHDSLQCRFSFTTLQVGHGGKPSI